MKIVREEVFGMKMDHKEMAMLKELASKHGMTKSGYIRYILYQLSVNGYVAVEKNWKEAENA